MQKTHCCKSELYNIFTYKHDNIDIHMRQHANFKIFFFNVRVSTEFLKLMYGPNINMYGFLKILCKDLTLACTDLYGFFLLKSL